MGEEDSIEAAALARRERLNALKAARELSEAADAENLPDNQDDDQNNNNDNISLKFRNYLPHDKELQDGKLAPPVLPKFEDPVLAVAPPEDEKKEDPFLNIAPKKPNWDLRRDVQKRLDKLERRTQKSMVVLMEREEANRRQGEDATSGGEMQD